MLRIVMMMACLSVGQVRAEMFDTSRLSASDFDTLGYLSDRWESKADALDQMAVQDGTAASLVNLAVSSAYRECADDLKGFVEKRSPKPGELLVAQQPADFGQVAPTNNPGTKVPVSPEFEKKYPTPNQAPVQAPQKQVQAPSYSTQAPMTMACGMQTQTPVYSNYSSGGRWRLFGRRANGGGFRLFGRRGGC